MVEKHPTSFPLRLSPSLRGAAIRLAKQDNISLNHFISLAVAEKISRLEQAEWLKKREREGPSSPAANPLNRPFTKFR